MEIWQVEVSGQIYEANFEELTQWIAEGALLKQDKVKRGNLRWLEAGKIPILHGFFNARELGIAPPAVTATDGTNPVLLPQLENSPAAQAVIQNSPAQNFAEVQTFTNQTERKTFENLAVNTSQFGGSSPNACSVHPEAEAKFVCGDCGNLFCKACPRSYGGTVKICPGCGAICKSISEVHASQQKAVQYYADLSHGFSFGDFGQALAYPFKFKASLISGGLLFMFFTIGQSAAGMGGYIMIAAAIFAAMMANALTFGVLANTVDNMAQGQLGKNFMPDFDDFSIWDDVVHPFFLSIGAYIASFGLLIVLVAGMVWYTINQISSIQTSNFNQISRQLKDAKADPAFTQNWELNSEEVNLTPAQRQALEDKEIEELQNLIQESGKGQLESVVGKNPEARQKETMEIFGNILKVGIPFLGLAFLALLWGLFYFPAACAVAGYTRSFTATINPLVGLDTIRRLGADYVKILVMCFLLALMSGFISGTIALFLSPFEMPALGNIPAKAVSSLFTFYFSIVFAVTLGFALYKNSAKLSLYRA